jgi:hypothetical protein
MEVAVTWRSVVAMVPLASTMAPPLVPSGERGDDGVVEPSEEELVLAGFRRGLARSSEESYQVLHL